jgi:Mn-dependent DtxR family transcriptional regulator
MPRKSTEAVLTRIREVEMARRAIPTRAQLAKELGLSESMVNKIASKMTVGVNDLIMAKP